MFKATAQITHSPENNDVTVSPVLTPWRLNCVHILAVTESAAAEESGLFTIHH